jgi:hypothetical protein
MKTSEGTSFVMNIVDMREEINGAIRLVLQTEPRRPKIDVTLSEIHTKVMDKEDWSIGDKVVVALKKIEEE